MAGIGICGDIIPNDFIHPQLGSLLQTVLMSGFKLLDLNFNFSREEIDKTVQLPQLQNACEGN